MAPEYVTYGLLLPDNLRGAAAPRLQDLSPDSGPIVRYDEPFRLATSYA